MPSSESRQLPEQVILDNSGIAYALVGDISTAAYTYLNPAFYNFIGVTPDLLQAFNVNSTADLSPINPTAAGIKHAIHQTYIDYIQTNQLKPFHVQNSQSQIFEFSLSRNSDNTFLLTGRDITTEELLRLHRQRDPQTNAFNHEALEEFSGLIAGERRSGHQITSLMVIFIDQDNVGEINKSNGTKAGDEHISNFISLLHQNFRVGNSSKNLNEAIAQGDDLIFRLYTRGDEVLIVILNPIPDDLPKIVNKINQLRQENLTPFPFSYGCYYCHSDGQNKPIDINQAIERAETQMIIDKQHKTARQQTYDPNPYQHRLDLISTGFFENNDTI